MSAAVLLAGLAVSNQAEAAYAYASNQISGLIIDFADGSNLLPANVIGTATHVNDSATFVGSTGVTNSNDGVVGSALNLPQATSGPGPFPAENTFSRFPAIVGSRADAFISAGTAISGGTTVDNVAEVRGGIGGSNSGNTAGLTFTVVGTGKAIRVSFVDLIQLVATTVATETATAAISNSFQLTDSNDNSIFSANPSSINLTRSSASGIPPTATAGPSIINFTGLNALVTPVLTLGESYTVNLSSSATVNVRGLPIPEPFSLTLLGIGLAGLGLVSRRRA